ncbi:hypothetical protein VTK73DRAFT_1450 [Phialemonium thermophilum]|uniref:Uncharacterized protein n=1 Tax=Phialemonium thermophilum TaxID=223376 RepID=A0ABR3VTF8_9PEZI
MRPDAPTVSALRTLRFCMRVLRHDQGQEDQPLLRGQAAGEGPPARGRARAVHGGRRRLHGHQRGDRQARRARAPERDGRDAALPGAQQRHRHDAAADGGGQALHGLEEHSRPRTRGASPADGAHEPHAEHRPVRRREQPERHVRSAQEELSHDQRPPGPEPPDAAHRRQAARGL